MRGRSGAVIAQRFPYRLEQVRGRSPLQLNSLKRELAWAAAQLVEDAPRIVRFLRLKAEFERQLCGSQAAAALRILDALERDLGFSLWSVEARINALQIQNGLEAQKAFLATMRKVLPGNDVTSFVAHHVSRRCEPSTLPLRFARAFAQLTAQWNDATGLDRYLNYRIAGVAPTTAREYANLLHHETASTSIDQYETLLYLARTAATSGDAEIAAAFEGPVLRLVPLTQDERLAKIVAVRGGDDGFPFLGFVNDDATDHALAGDMEQARDTVGTCVAVRPHDPRLWLLTAHLAEAVGDALPQGRSLADQCCYDLQAVIGEGDEGGQAYIQLLRLSLTLQALSFSPSAVLFTFQAITSHRWAVRPMEQMSFVERIGTRADDVALLPEALRPAFLEAARTALGDVAAVARGYALAGLPYDGVATLGPDEAFRASVEALLVRHDERAALALLLPSVEVAGEERSRWAIRHAAMCMASLGDFLALARFIVRYATRRPGLLRSLPVAECVDGLTDGDRAILKRELTLPILLHFAFQQDDGASADARAFAYEDFLIANGMARPSEISRSGSGFDIALLIFYLRNVCIPEIMQVSSEFQSTRELQEERIAVLRVLVELDPENAKDYEDELRETTRTLLVHSGVRHVGQTKIFVDIPALRRWAERNHKEDYARLLTHLQVGMGIENDLVASAYQREAQAKQPGAGMLEVPKHEATDLLVKMVISLLREFLANPDHGLDCYLSMRIRHGTLSGQLRTPLEVENLITQRRAASEEYALNEHWVSALDQHRVPSGPVVDRLARFSSEYDELIAEMSSELIQIRSAERPQGLFDIRIPVKHLLFISGRLTPDVSFEDFLDLCIELFWGFVDLCLRNVRGVCEERLKPRVTEMFTSLEADVAPLAGAARHDLERAIRSARTGAHQALDIVGDWFRLPAPQEEPVFPIEAMIDVGLQCVTTIYPDFRPDLRQRVPSLPPFRGALALFSDIFFIVFDNIRRHSGSSTPRVDLTIDDLFTTRLRVRIASDLAEDVDVVSIEAKLREIRERIATDDYRSAVTSEGGTGLIKLHRILRGRSSLDGRFEFGVEKGRFVVDLELSARTVSS